MPTTKCIADHHQCALTSILFDPKQELLWIGNALGFVQSLILDSSTGMFSKFVRHRAHDGLPVSQLIFSNDYQSSHHYHRQHAKIRRSTNLNVKDHFIISVAADSVSRISATSGRLINHLTNETLWTQLTSAEWCDHEIVVMGHSPCIFTMKSDAGLSISRNIDAESGIRAVKMAKSALVCGTIDGKLILKDRDTLRTWHTIYAYSGSISDMDVWQDFLIVAGYVY